MLVLALVVVLTFVLGSTTALAFYLVGGPPVLWGPEVVWESWPAIYPLLAALAAVVLFAVGLLPRARLTPLSLAAVVAGAWLGQYLILASGVLADELTAANSVGYWLLATGVLVQPIAAFVGGMLGLWLAGRPPMRQRDE